MKNTLRYGIGCSLLAGALAMALMLPAFAGVDGDWTLSGNTLTGVEKLGASNSVPLLLVINNKRVLEIAPATAGTNAPKIRAGHPSNTATCDGATVSGGGYAGYPNQASSLYATVGGGAGNTASGQQSAVSGGYRNMASGERATVGGGVLNTALEDNATVAGGRENEASGSESTVGGGWYNVASGNYGTVGGGTSNAASASWAVVGGGVHGVASESCATVGGGWYNVASAGAATVPGGYECLAGGYCSLAAGCQARTTTQGTFVWADSTDAHFDFNTANAFGVRASGGVKFYSSSSLFAGVSLAPGGGTWTNISDRNVKDNLAPVAPEAVLDKVAALPISTWSYKSQDPSVRHMGPMAQDLYAAFGLGESDTGIDTIDADGVALAAIQGLHGRNQEQAAEIKTLKEQVRDLAAQVETLKALVQQRTKP